ncbi:MAG: hypothetical protein RI947_925 [Candidatus Parcubacteria bacterium]|jgi:hypothetical protein
MNVYFTGSIAAKDQYIANYQAIIKYLQSKGHQVTADHILKASESQIRISTREDRIKFHEQLEKWIKSCDFMIAETSFPSISVGYEISLALRVGKPVLILYSEGDPPSLLAQHKDDKMICEKYTIATVKDIITDYIEYIQGKNDLRFTFFITPDIMSYLDEIARTEKLPKSVYLRKLIEQDMKNRRRSNT